MTTLSLLFEEIDKNLKFFIERKEIHSKIINHLVNVVKSLSIYKILAIILVGFSQIYMIIRLFKGKRVNGNPFTDNENL